NPLVPRRGQYRSSASQFLFSLKSVLVGRLIDRLSGRSVVQAEVERLDGGYTRRFAIDEIRLSSTGAGCIGRRLVETVVAAALFQFDVFDLAGRRKNELDDR